MTIEPSDIVKMLKQAAHEHGDPTCHALGTLAERGEPILKVCYEAIRILASEKAIARKRALDLDNAAPPRPIVLTTKHEGLGLGRTSRNDE